MAAEMSVECVRALIDAERLEFGVPGVAVAVLVDGEVLLCEGFGVADVATGREVTADTHFPLASDTKAFTAALLCRRAAEGRLDLDAPVRDVLPWFALHDPVASGLVTPRDLLAHRTGLPRHDFVWIGDEPQPVEQIVRSLRHLPVSRPPRSTWDYNNLTYITAGHLNEVITGVSWRDAVQQELLTPLGMDRSAFCVQDTDRSGLALPYKSAGDGYALQQLPARSTAEKAGAAGGLVSTARELTSWLLARLGGRPEVLAPDVLAQLHQPAMLGGITPEAFPEVQSLGYALGCQVESYRGVRVVHHGGNITGYSSDVCVVPGAGIGIAVLANLDGSYLRLALVYGLLDRLLGLDPIPWGERARALEAERRATLASRRSALCSAPPSRPLEGFCGSYQHPAYGTLVVRQAKGELIPEFHRLGDRIRLEHRAHDVWDLFFTDEEEACPLVFQQGPDGRIVSLAVALEEAVPPMQFARVDAAGLAGVT